jgi:tRNA (cytidine/uridine-2'-O-)-methyltransferase
MFNIVLFEPEIPPNTGNIIRLCSNTGCALHVIEPLGFQLDDKRLRRAGLDYGEWKDIRTHENWSSFVANCQPEKMYGLSTKGRASYVDTRFEQGDYLVFGPETRGLPETIRDAMGDGLLRIPMSEHSRSMNLSNAVAVILFEALRQQSFPGMQ